MGNVFKWLAIAAGSILALGALVLVLWVAGRLTHAFDFYHTPSDSNAPSFHIGDRFFASPLLKPERLDFIVFRTRLPEDGTTIFINRLCGLPGDTVALRRGRLFVNGQDLDAGLRLAHHYSLARTDFARLPRTLWMDTTGIVPLDDSLHRVGLADADAARLARRAVRQVQSAGYPNPAILRTFPVGRNEDNFGPVVVPAGAYFVLGDNRQNARDSRYIGWVRQADVAGTVLGRH